MNRLDPSSYLESRSREIALDSGCTVLVRKPFLERMLTTYNLHPKWMELQRARMAAQEADTQAARDEMAAAYAEDAFSLNCALICDASVDPPMSLTREPGKLCVLDLDQADYLKLSHEVWAMLGVDPRGAEVLAPFREQDSGSGVGTETQDAAEPTAG